MTWRMFYVSLAIIAVTAVGMCSFARADEKTLDVTSCTTQEAIIEYTNKVFVDRVYWKQVLESMGDKCIRAITTFSYADPVHTFEKNGIKFEVIPIMTIARMVPVAPGVSAVQYVKEGRFAIRFSPVKGTDA